ncbi:hypothetical protein ACFRJ8_14680 [Arthrobacter sp. NPDC056886]|uniref:hypothetical protein n=1 Tax=Arthrobacter sp. NPDC056886 TaxID=3345960 RepID=UPI00366A5DD0
MLPIDDVSRAALDGSRPADELVVWAWYDGDLAWPDPLGVVSWSLSGSSDASTKVQRQLSLKVADADGSLSPWLFDDPLGVGGVVLQVVYRVGGAGAVNVGWFRVEGNAPDGSVNGYTLPEYGYLESDSPAAPHERRVFAFTGAVVDVDAVDLTADVDRDKFLAPQSPYGTGPTVLGEVTRLVRDHFPVVVEDGVTDKAVSGKLVYERERLEAVQDLLANVSARFRMGGDGEMHIYPMGAAAPAWRVEPGAGLVSVHRKQTIDGLYNAWVVEGKEGANGKPVTATAFLRAGPLRWDGPHGRVPYFYSSEMITTRGQAAEYAGILRDRQAASYAVELEVETVPRPEIQAGDRIEVGCPMPAGHVVYLPGEVVSVSAGGSPIPGPTKFTVSCAYADVAIALNTTPFAEHLTSTKPALTWDRMPSSWGALPAITWNNLP